MEANVAATAKALFRKETRPAGQTRALGVRAQTGGWVAGGAALPDLPLDTDVVTEAELASYVAALTRNGFRGPISWYMNHEANSAYHGGSANDGRLDMPVLLLHGLYDYTCETVDSRLAEPMRQSCSNLTEHVVKTGHWMAQEIPSR